MNKMEQVRTDLLPAGLPFFWLVVIVLLAVLLWAAARWVTHKYSEKLPAYAILVPRCVTAIVAAWAGFQFLGRFVEFGCRWPVWGAALMTGLAVEASAAFYKRERRVVPHRLGLAVSVLRGAVITLAAVLIMQPVAVTSVERHVERRVAVLVDESSSMQFTDELWTPTEKLSWGKEFGFYSAANRPLATLDNLKELQPKLQIWTQSAGGDRVEDPDGQLQALLDQGVAATAEVRADLEKCIKEMPSLAAPENKEHREVLDRMLRLVRDSLGKDLDNAARSLKRGDLRQNHLKKAVDALALYNDAVPGVRTAADTAFWSGLDENIRASIDTLCTTTRVALARKLLLSHDRKNQTPFLDALASRYDVDLFRMGRQIGRVPRLSEKHSGPAATLETTDEPEPGDGAATNQVQAAGIGFHEPGDPETATQITWDIDAWDATQTFRMMTDYTTALESLTQEIPSEALAGVLVVSDGLHNGTASFDPIARRLGSQDVRVMGVVVGGSSLPFDIALGDVQAPESVFLGDNVRVRTLIHATHAKGRKIKVQLALEGSNVVDSVELDVPKDDDDWRYEVRFKHQPEAQGLVRYDISTDVLEGELFDDNNHWSVDVAVSDDRTNVLLVDNYPRWEFRYLRNLFYGRDKSVHLQSYLVHPDLITGLENEAVYPPASASRKFGDAEAGALPESAEEWRKFDVIILGDLGPDILTEDVMEEIRYCVAERGALLVLISGMQAMPHAFDQNSLLRQMLPVVLDPYYLSVATPPDPDGYTFTLTPQGTAHPVMQQSPSFAENEAIWQQVPDLGWRIPLAELKPGAEALAYAEPKNDPAVPAKGFALEDAAEQLDEAMKRRTRNALIVASGYGRGKMLTLMFDRTWRFRYRTGDTHHHRFWGQVMRWGVGEKLRAGDEHFRVGTDQVVYLPGSPVEVMGRVLNNDGTAASGVSVDAAIEREDGSLVARQRLNPRKDSTGGYESTFKGIDTPGRYKVRLLRRDTGARVETQFLVSPTRRPVEFADVAAKTDNLERIARWTGGRVVMPDEIDQLLDAFGEGRRTFHERNERPLWSHPLFFILIVSMLTLEWFLRKKGNLV